MKWLCAVIVMTVFPAFLFSQGTNMQTEQVDLEGNETLICDIELSPDQSFMAMSTKNGPVLLYDFNSRQITKKIDCKSWFIGADLSFSRDGKYLLLLQRFSFGYGLNKDYKGAVEVINTSTGETVFRKNKVHYASLSPGSEMVAIISDNDVELYQLEDVSVGSGEEETPSGKRKTSFQVENATYALAISPDGKTVAVSRKPNENDLDNIASIRNDKKARKSALKYRNVISFYDLETGKLKYTSTEVLDIVYGISYTPDGKEVLVYNAPHTKIMAVQATAGGPAGRQGYLNVVDASTGKVSRTGYLSLVVDPDFKRNPSGNITGISTLDPKHPALVLYNSESGSILTRYVMDGRFGEMIRQQGRLPFAFLPDGKTVVMGHGPGLVYWKFNE